MMKNRLFSIIVVAATIMVLGFIRQPVAMSFQPVVVVTKEIKNITSSGAVCDYSFTRTGGKIEHGVCLNTDGTPAVTSKSSKIFRGAEDKTVMQTVSCSAKLSPLKSKVKYYVRAFEKLSDGTVVYGAEKSFTTL
jgi:hypothetical protein